MVIDFIGPQLKKNTRNKIKNFENEFYLRQANRKKFYELFGEWFFVLGILFAITYPLFKTPKIQTSDIVQIIIVLLFSICYTIWILCRRKKIKEKLEKF